MWKDITEVKTERGVLKILRNRGGRKQNRHRPQGRDLPHPARRPPPLPPQSWSRTLAWEQGGAQGQGWELEGRNKSRPGPRRA